MARSNKFYKGTVEEFKDWLCDLHDASTNSDEDAKKYDEIKNSVIYISNNIGVNPNDYYNASTNFDGAIFANGAIIRSCGGDTNMYWSDSESDCAGPTENNG